LRFSPDEKLLWSYMSSQPKPEMPKGEATLGMPEIGSSQGNTGKVVWVKNDSILRPVTVETGLDDDINIEITAGLNQGDEVILSMEEQTVAVEKTAATGNPFMPRPPGAARR
ncbi:MAG TPA: efflux RND transporter periplasmic adaptor subunit, partial [Draconibacterium sp.]|nr:efflux RND transporter periplasmic adaptor subunit [Draconibacterium sp.]